MPERINRFPWPGCFSSSIFLGACISWSAVALEGGDNLAVPRTGPGNGVVPVTVVKEEGYRQNTSGVWEATRINAKDQTAELVQGTSVEVVLVVVVSNPGSALKFTIESSPRLGTLGPIRPRPVSSNRVLRTAGVVYTSTGGKGTDRFIYRVCDVSDHCDAAVVSVTVAPPVMPAPPPPDDVTAIDQAVSTETNAPVVIKLSASVRSRGHEETNPAANPIGEPKTQQFVSTVRSEAGSPFGVRFMITELPELGTLEDENGRRVVPNDPGKPISTPNVVYTPNPGVAGRDTFTWEATLVVDGRIVSTDAGTAIIEVR